MRRNEEDERDNTIDAMMDAYTSGVGYGAFNNSAFTIKYTHDDMYHVFKVKIVAPERFNRQVKLTFKLELSEYISIVELADALIGVLVSFDR